MCGEVWVSGFVCFVCYVVENEEITSRIRFHAGGGAEAFSHNLGDENGRVGVVGVRVWVSVRGVQASVFVQCGVLSGNHQEIDALAGWAMHHAYLASTA